MSESNIEDPRRAERRGAPGQTPAEILAELRQEFMPIVLRLTPEVEPAVAFRLEPHERETGS